MNAFKANDGIRTRRRGTGRQIHRDSARRARIGQQVIASAGIQAVIARAAIQRIRAIAARQCVIARIALDEIIPIKAKIAVIARQQVNRVCAIAADKGIVARRRIGCQGHQALRRKHGRIPARACCEGDKATSRGATRPVRCVIENKAVIAAAKNLDHIGFRTGTHRRRGQVQDIAATRQINRIDARDAADVVSTDLIPCIAEHRNSITAAAVAEREVTVRTTDQVEIITQSTIKAVIVHTCIDGIGTITAGKRITAIAARKPITPRAA